MEKTLYTVRTGFSLTEGKFGIGNFSPYSFDIDGDEK